MILNLVLNEEDLPRFIDGAKILIKNQGCFSNKHVVCYHTKNDEALCPLATVQYMAYCASAIDHSTKDRQISMVKGAKLFLAEHCKDALEYLL